MLFLIIITFFIEISDFVKISILIFLKVNWNDISKMAQEFSTAISPKTNWLGQSPTKKAAFVELRSPAEKLQDTTGAK